MLDRRMALYLYLGLACAIVANIAAVSLMIANGMPYFAGNLAAAIVACGAIGLVRWRRRQDREDDRG